MGWVIHLTLLSAQTQQAAIDAFFGWPKVGSGVCQRVHIGGGRHVDHPKCCTTNHTRIIQHPTLSQWAVWIPDQTSRDLLGAVTIVQLSRDWFSGQQGI